MLQFVDPLNELGHTDILLVFIAEYSGYNYSFIQLEQFHNVVDGLII